MAIGGHSSIYQIGRTGPMMTQNTTFQPVGEWGIGGTAGVIAPGTAPSLTNLVKFWQNIQVTAGPPATTTPWVIPMMIVDNFSFSLKASTTGIGDITWQVQSAANTPDGKVNTWAKGPGAFTGFGSNGAMGGSFFPNNILGNGSAAANYSLTVLLPDNGNNYIGVAGWTPGSPPATGPTGAAGGNPFLAKRGTWNLSFTMDFTPAAINQHTTQLPAVFNTFAAPRRQNISIGNPSVFGAYSQFLIDSRNLSAASNSWTLANIPLRGTALWDFSFAWGIIGITSGGDYSQGVTGDLCNLVVAGTCIETIGSGY